MSVLNSFTRSNPATEVEVHPDVKQMTITPELAKEWLDNCNTANYRQPASKNVAYLVNQIKQGRFTLTQDCISFDVHKRLINGQHRLMACVAAGKSIVAFVAQNMPVDEDGTAIDRGRMRTSADDIIAHNFDCHNPKLMASAARLLVLWHKGVQDNHASGFRGNKCYVTPHEVIEFAERNRELLTRSANYVGAFFPKHAISFRLQQRFIVALHFLMSKTNPELADAFMRYIADGAGAFGLTSPVYLLKNALVSSDCYSRKRGDSEWVSLYIKAWTYMIEGKEVQRLKIDDLSTPALLING